MKKVYAQGIKNKALPNLDRFPDRGLAFYMANLWKTISILGGVALILFLVWGAIDWLMSEGDQQKLSAARNKMTHALIGMAVLAASYAIILFLNTVFDINLLQPEWPTAPGYTPAAPVSGGGTI